MPLNATFPTVKQDKKTSFRLFQHISAVCRCIKSKPEKNFFNPQQIFPPLYLQCPGRLMSFEARSSIKEPQNKAAELQQHGVRKPVNEPQVKFVVNWLIYLDVDCCCKFSECSRHFVSEAYWLETQIHTNTWKNGVEQNPKARPKMWGLRRLFKHPGVTWVLIQDQANKSKWVSQRQC